MRMVKFNHLIFNGIIMMIIVFYLHYLNWDMEIGNKLLIQNNIGLIKIQTLMKKIG